MSETRFADQGQLTEEGAGYTFFWSGKPADERRESGVGFAISNTTLSSLDSLPVGINDRIMKLRVPLMDKQHLTLLSVYAPTMTNPEETKNTFYQQLKDTIRSIPRKDRLLILGDFNARVGSDHTNWPGVIGKHGIGRVNSNGLLLLSLCAEHGLNITNTVFQLPLSHKVTWMHPRSKHWHQIDFVLTRQSDLRDVRITRTLRGADCWTDHCLVRTKLKLQAPKRKKLYGIRPPRKINVEGLKSPHVQSQYQRQLFESLANVDPTSKEVDLSWAEFRDRTLEAAEKTLGLQKRKSKDWFDDNDESIRDLLSQKNLALAESIADTTNECKSQKFRRLRSLV